MVVRLNRPDRMNALGAQLRAEVAQAFREFKENPDLEFAVLTGIGLAFCAGEGMKESLERGAPGSDSQPVTDPFREGKLEKPVIAAVNGFAMGGGFIPVERTDLRVAVRNAVFEMSEANASCSAVTTTACSPDCRIPSRRKWRSASALAQSGSMR